VGTATAVAPAPAVKKVRLTGRMLQRRQNYQRRRSGRLATFFRNLRWHGNPRLRVNPKGLWFDLTPFVYGPTFAVVIDAETENIVWNPQPVRPVLIFPQQDGRIFTAEPSNLPIRLYWCDSAIPRCAAMVDGELVLCSWVLTTTWETLMAGMFKRLLPDWDGKWHVISLPEVRTARDATLTWGSLRRDVYSNLLLNKPDACVMYNDDGSKRRFASLPTIKPAKLPKRPAGKPKPAAKFRATYPASQDAMQEHRSVHLEESVFAKTPMILPPPREYRRRARVTEYGYHTSAERTLWNRLERKWAIVREKPGLETPAQRDALHAWYRGLQCRAIESNALLSALSTLRPRAVHEYVDRRDAWTAQPLRDWDSRGKKHHKKRRRQTT
jgi:hypothetical protein